MWAPLEIVVRPGEVNHMAGPRASEQLVKAILGPTNTGKTHLAVERMLAHASGMIGLPLRLLAREVYDKVVAAKGAGAAALITGEEKIVPDNARYFICTVEAMPLDRPVDCLAIDEVQVARDPDRGHVFTERILHARGFGETMLLGSSAMRPMLRRLLPNAEFAERERMSELSYVGPRKLSKLPKRTAIVAFSAEEVYAIAELIRRHRGGAAVVMGALSPRTRNAQVELYQSGEVDFLIATDAIGMGLNMDVDHVAFASRRKFDGHRWRDLRADEIAQIAGRAGRFHTDGSFGETGECAPFEERDIERVEAHEFEPVEQIMWRNHRLAFNNIEALIKSLETPPQQPGLVRARGADDEDALKRVASEPDIADKLNSPHAVQRLWDVCQLPDFRKVSPEEHARLVSRIALALLESNGRIQEDWIAREVERLDRTEGDLDALQQRLAHVRTWTYVSHRGDWLTDAEHWRETTRAVEDRLSDALHAALTQRFIDKRTSALLKGLKREDALLAGVSEDGEVTVEGHYLGRLEGLDFKPDPRAFGLEGRAVRNAALRALRPEVSRRLRAIAHADEFELTREGRVRFEGAVIARLEQGGATLKPRIALIGASDAADVERAPALARVEAWLAKCISADLRPLVQLERAWREGDLPLAARGLAYRVLENAGVRDRREETLDDLTAQARKALAKLGLRIGRHAIFFPALLKPRPARLHAILRRAADADEAPLFLPRPGAVSVPLTHPISWRAAAAAGYRPCGELAVRFDQLERLSGAIGSAGKGGEAPLDSALARVIARPPKDLAGVLGALGYRKAAAAEEGAPERWRAPATPKAAPKPRPRHVGNSPFAALAELSQPPRRRPKSKRPKTKPAPSKPAPPKEAPN